MKNLRLLSDEATSGSDGERLDGLDFKTYAEVLARAASGTTGPFTIGVFGPWGTGKTSLLRMIQRKLDDEHKDVITVWFNAWRYERESHPIVPLIATIIRKLERNKDFPDKFGDTGRTLLRSLRAVAYGFSAKSKLQIPGFAQIEAGFVAKDMIDREEKLTPDPLLDRSLYYEAFDLLSKVDQKKSPKIIIIVDDLDRCFPDRAIELLESIKLVLAQPGFIFFLGVSRTVIEGYLQHRYEKEYGLPNFNGQQYLDKIVQLPFYVPPHSSRIRKFTDSLLKDLEIEDRDVLRGILPIVGLASRSNPRAVIRFINNLLIDREIYENLPKEEDFKIPILYFAVTRALQLHWNQVYLTLIQSEELCQKIVEWKSGFPDDDELATYNEEEVEVAIELQSNQELQNLLFEHGSDWLMNPDLRMATIEFLIVTGRIDKRRQRSTEILCIELIEIILDSVPGIDDPVVRTSLLVYGFDIVERSHAAMLVHNDKRTHLDLLVDYASNLGKIDMLIENARRKIPATETGAIKRLINLRNQLEHLKATQ